MKNVLDRSTRELVWGTAVLAVTLGMIVTGHDVPQILGTLVAALVLSAATKPPVPPTV